MNVVRGSMRGMALLGLVGLLAACGSKGGGGGTPPTAPPSPSGQAFVCPSTGASPQSVVAANERFGVPRRIAPRREPKLAYLPGMLAVLYDRPSYLAGATRRASDEVRLGVRQMRVHDYPRLREVSRVLAVAPANVATAMAALRQEPGVKSVSRVGLRYPSAVTTPYVTNDPYFRGFAPTAAPYYESADVPGQWGMHAIGLAYAFGYSQNGNGSGIINAGALGSRTVSIAIIDTGEDLTHPELHGTKVIHTGCFITDPNSGVQSTGPFVTDRDGHGTDVAGIAGANANNALGFVGAGGNAALMAYRVFPTPDDSCLGNNADSRCSTNSLDVAAAIDDAVSSGANVVSMSFGGCTAGGTVCCPDDNVEGPAVANAIASGVVVVAAAGNDGTNEIEAPACDKGVIAVGASGLADGVRNGTNSNASGEYVAGYSSYGNGNWGIVAPGGDPYCPNASACGDTDNLHWIANIYTSTPFDSNFAGLCAPDYPNQNGSGTTDCRILIAGTSMATPMVAGAAALILSATGRTYQSASAMFGLLCATADSISDPHQGCGRLDVYRAMAKALNDPNQPPSSRLRGR